MSTAVKAIQDKLAVEANDFQALQKGASSSSRDLRHPVAACCSSVV